MCLIQPSLVLLLVGDVTGLRCQGHNTARLTARLCSSARRLYSACCCAACFFKVSVSDQLQFASQRRGRTKVLILALGSFQLLLELFNAFLHFLRLAIQSTLLCSLLLEGDIVFLNVDKVQDDVEDPRKKKGEEQGSAGEVDYIVNSPLIKRRCSSSKVEMPLTIPLSVEFASSAAA